MDYDTTRQEGCDGARRTNREAGRVARVEGGRRRLAGPFPEWRYCTIRVNTSKHDLSSMLDESIKGVSTRDCSSATGGSLGDKMGEEETLSQAIGDLQECIKSDR
jgi:hypothetical protein